MSRLQTAKFPTAATSRRKWTPSTTQIAKQKDHLNIVNDHLADLELLFSKGLLRKDVLLNQRIEKSIVEGQVSNLQAQVARLQQSMGELDVRLGDVKAAFQTQTLTQLQDTSQRLRDIENSIGSARRLLQVKAQGVDSDAPEYTIRVSRTRDGSMTTFDATEDTVLLPGDVVEVQMKRQIWEDDSCFRRRRCLNWILSRRLPRALSPHLGKRPARF